MQKEHYPRTPIVTQIVPVGQYWSAEVRHACALASEWACNMFVDGDGLPHAHVCLFDVNRTTTSSTWRRTPAATATTDSAGEPPQIGPFGYCRHAARFINFIHTQLASSLRRGGLFLLRVCRRRRRRRCASRCGCGQRLRLSACDCRQPLLTVHRRNVDLCPQPISHARTPTRTHRGTSAPSWGHVRARAA